jgi:hypothetical protein
MKAGIICLFLLTFLVGGLAQEPTGWNGEASIGIIASPGIEIIFVQGPVDEQWIDTVRVNEVGPMEAFGLITLRNEDETLMWNYTALGNGTHESFIVVR